MRLPVVVAQLTTSASVEANEEAIARAITQCQAGELLVTPEGALSGYDDDMCFLRSLEPARVERALANLAETAQAAGVFAWVGSVMRVGNSWANCAVGLSPDGARCTYQKANLSNPERASGRFAAGNTLPLFELATPQGTAHVGVQLCREVRFPEQWRTLADKGAQLLLHLTNGRGSPTWRPQLISRAAENQRFVVSASNASPIQLSNSMVIAPDGAVVDELEQPEPGLLRTMIDLERVSDSLLTQRRTDLH
jgi:predicted amidohydrolase